MFELWKGAKNLSSQGESRSHLAIIPTNYYSTIKTNSTVSAEFLSDTMPNASDTQVVNIMKDYLMLNFHIYLMLK